jgi:hypothetical protein
MNVRRVARSPLRRNKVVQFEEQEHSMATATTETDSGRPAAFPNISDTAWWQLRKLFQGKGVPKIFDVNYVLTAGLRESEASASNLVRPFKRLGLFSNDGKPTQLAYDWTYDDKYKEVCKKILLDIYPAAPTEMFTEGTEEDRTGVVRWLQRNLHLTPHSARQYAVLYILLAKGDPTEQEEGASSQPAKSAKPTGAANGQRRAPRSRPTTAAAAPAAQTPLFAVPVEEQLVQGVALHHPQRAPQPRNRPEPTLNINVQVHIPAEATPELIDAIFESMAKHLWQRQDEASA